MECIVDVQGFRKSFNEFVFKEVAILTVQEDAVPSVFYFQPPKSWAKLKNEEKSVNRWLEKNYHGISWRSGDIPYDKLKGVLQGALTDCKKIYVKGFEKKMWLQGVLPKKSICNLEELGCPALKNLPHDASNLCSNHVFWYKPVCAVQNAHALKSWLLHYRLLTRDMDYEGEDCVDEKEKLYSMYS